MATEREIELMGCDIYDDVDGGPTQELDATRIIRNLSLRWCWTAIMGVHPAKPHVAEYTQRFGNTDVSPGSISTFIRTSCGVPLSLSADIIAGLERTQEAYSTRLKTDQNFLHLEVLSKLWDRYVSPHVQNMPATLLHLPLFDAYERIILTHSPFASMLGKRCTSLEAFFELASHTIKSRSLLVVNVLTGSRNPTTTAVALKWCGKLSVEEALRWCIARDAQLATTLSNAPMVFLDRRSPSEDDMVIIEAANKTSSRPVVRVSHTKSTSGASFHIADLYIPPVLPNVIHYIPRLSSKFVWLTDASVEKIAKDAPIAKSLVAGGNIALLPGVGNNRSGFPVPWMALCTYDRVLVNDSAVVNSLRKKSMAGGGPSIYLMPQAEDGTRTFMNSDPLRAVMWKYHLGCSGCPIRSRKPQDGILLFLQFLVMYLQCNATAIADRASRPLCGDDDSKNMKNTVLICDNRPSILSALSLIVTMTNLQEGCWGVTVACPKDVEPFFRGCLPVAWMDQIKWIRLDDAPREKFSVQSYSDLLKSAAFWNKIPEDRCLIVQDDGMIVRPGVEQFLEYDYTGAPWVRHPGNNFLETAANPLMVGNGGVSLRNCRVMEQICKHHPQAARELFANFGQELPEDCFFSRFVYRDGHKLCPEQLAKGFACEQVLHSSTLGFHKPWPYHSPADVQAFFDKLLEQVV